MNKLTKKHFFALGYLIATLMAFGGYGLAGDQLKKGATWLSNLKAENPFKS